MCGIAGIVGARGADHREALARMVAGLAHRGPDAGGQFDDPANGVFLGHRRLSILDLATRSNQPFFSPDRQQAIVFNGEVYNFVELRDELKLLGYSFETTSDTEVVLHAFRAWGTACFARFRGMFAIGIYDFTAHELILARDPLGIKPICFLQHGGTLSFASESRVLWRNAPGGESCRCDRARIEMLMAHSYLPDAAHTIVENIRKVPPGSFMRFRDGREDTVKYWSLHVDHSWDSLSFEDGCNRFHDLFRDTMKIMLRSDVPLGFLLSGGLDSSYVLATAKECGMPDLRTFTAVFGHELDEGEFAKTVARQAGSKHQEVRVQVGDVASEFTKVIQSYDDLNSMDGGLFTTSIISRLITEAGIKVAFVGEGSDEIFGGYSWFGLAQMPFRLMPVRLRALAYYYATTRMWTPGYWHNSSRVIDAFRSSGDRDVFRQVSACEVNMQLPNNLLQKVDRATMSASLEARVPFMDHEVVTAAYSMPACWKRRGSWFDFNAVQEKYIVRKLAEKKVSPEIAWRKKRGFMLPIADLILQNRGFVEDLLLSKDSYAMEWMGSADIRKTLDFRKTMYQPFEKQKEVMLWRLLLLSLWHREVFKAPQVRPS